MDTALAGSDASIDLVAPSPSTEEIPSVSNNSMSNNATVRANPKKNGTSKVPTHRPAKGRPAEGQAASQRTKRAAAFEADGRRNRLLALGSIALVIVIVATLVVIRLAAGGDSTGSASAVSPAAGTAVPPALTNKLRSIPLSTLMAAPTGGLTVSPEAIDDPARTVAGQPDLLYIGAEFCPVCATERWAMYIALSKFGTFSPQPGRIHSALRDGDIQTLTFYGTTYSSPYLTFTPVETTTNQPEGDYYVALQNPTSAEVRLWASNTGESFPWLDFAGKLELRSSQFDPALLEGQSFDRIVSEIGNNSTPIGADIDASAKVLIQSICATLTGNRPSEVCRAVGRG